MPKLIDWAQWNGRIRGLKLHVVYDPKADLPERLSVTPATVKDIAFGRHLPLKTGVNRPHLSRIKALQGICSLNSHIGCEATVRPSELKGVLL